MQSLWSRRDDVIREKNLAPDGVHATCGRPAPGGEPLLRVPKDLAYSFQSEEGGTIGLNRRLPRITQRDVLSTGRFEQFISRASSQTTR